MGSTKALSRRRGRDLDNRHLRRAPSLASCRRKTYPYADKPMDDPTNLALVLLAAFWSGTSAVYTGIKQTNDARDRIISGNVGEIPLSARDQWHVFWWDWAPLKLSLASVSAVLFFVIIRLPALRKPVDHAFEIVCWVASSMPAIGTGFQLIAFVVEFLYLREAISMRRKSLEDGTRSEASDGQDRY
jgi:hypothetical protein